MLSFVKSSLLRSKNAEKKTMLFLFFIWDTELSAAFLYVGGRTACDREREGEKERERERERERKRERIQMRPDMIDISKRETPCRGLQNKNKNII